MTVIRGKQNTYLSFWKTVIIVTTINKVMVNIDIKLNNKSNSMFYVKNI